MELFRIRGFSGLIAVIFLFLTFLFSPLILNDLVYAVAPQLPKPGVQCYNNGTKARIYWATFNGASWYKVRVDLRLPGAPEWNGQHNPSVGHYVFDIDSADILQQDIDIPVLNNAGTVSVQAFDNEGGGSDSEKETVSCNGSENPLSGPQNPSYNLSAVCSGSNATLNWDGVGGAASYRIRVYNSNGEFAASSPFEVAGLSQSIPISPGQRYFFRSQALSPSGTSIPSKAVWFSCDGSTPITETPQPAAASLTAPNVSATCSADRTQLILNWNSVSGASEYEVRYGQNNDASDPFPTNYVNEPQSETTKTISVSDPNISFTGVKVRAIQKDGNGQIVAAAESQPQNFICERVIRYKVVIVPLDDSANPTQDIESLFAVSPEQVWAPDGNGKMRQAISVNQPGNKKVLVRFITNRKAGGSNTKIDQTAINRLTVTSIGLGTIIRGADASCQNQSVTYRIPKVDGAASYELRGYRKGNRALTTDEWNSRDHFAQKDLIVSLGNSCNLLLERNDPSQYGYNVTCRDEGNAFVVDVSSQNLISGSNYFLWGAVRDVLGTTAVVDISGNNADDNHETGKAVACGDLPSPALSQNNLICGDAGVKAKVAWSAVSGASHYQTRYDGPQGNQDLTSTEVVLDTKKSDGAAAGIDLQSLPLDYSSQEYGPLRSRSDRVDFQSCIDRSIQTKREMKPDESRISAACDGTTLHFAWGKKDNIDRYTIRAVKNPTNESTPPWDNNNLSAWFSDQSGRVLSKDVNTSQDSSVCNSSGECYTGIPLEDGSAKTDDIYVWVHSVKSSALAEEGQDVISDHGWLRQKISCKPEAPKNVTAACTNGVVTVSWDKTNDVTMKYAVTGVRYRPTGSDPKYDVGRGTFPDLATWNGSINGYSINDNEFDIKGRNITCGADNRCSFTTQAGNTLPGSDYFVWVNAINSGNQVSDPTKVTAAANDAEGRVADVVSCAPLPAPTINNDFNSACYPSGTKVNLSWTGVAGAGKYQLRLDKNLNNGNATWFQEGDLNTEVTSTASVQAVTPYQENTVDVQSIPNNPSNLTTSLYGTWNSRAIEKFSCDIDKPKVPEDVKASCDGKTLRITWTPPTGQSNITEYLIRGTRNRYDEIWNYNEQQLTDWYTPEKRTLETSDNCGKKDSSGKCLFEWEVPTTNGPTAHMVVWLHTRAQAPDDIPVNSDRSWVKEFVSCAPEKPENLQASCNELGNVTINWKKGANSDVTKIRGARNSDNLPSEGSDWEDVNAGNNPYKELNLKVDAEVSNCNGDNCSITYQGVPGSKYYLWATSHNQGPISSDRAFGQSPNPVTCAPLPAPSSIEQACVPSGTKAKFNWSSVNGADKYQIRLNNNLATWEPGSEPGPDKDLIKLVNTNSESYLPVTPGSEFNIDIQAIPAKPEGLDTNKYGATLSRNNKNYSCQVQRPKAPENLEASCDGKTLKVTWTPSTDSNLTQYLVRGSRNRYDEIWQFNEQQLTDWYTQDKRTLEASDRCEKKDSSGKCLFEWEVPTTNGPTAHMVVWLHTQTQAPDDIPVNSERSFVRRFVSCVPENPQNLSLSCNQTGQIKIDWNNGGNSEAFKVRAARNASSMPGTAPDFSNWETANNSNNRFPELNIKEDTSLSVCNGNNCSLTYQGVAGSSYFTWITAHNKSSIASARIEAGNNPVSCPALPSPTINKETQIVCGKSGRYAHITWGLSANAANYQIRYDKNKGTWRNTDNGGKETEDITPVVSEANRSAGIDVLTLPGQNNEIKIQALPAGITGEQYATPTDPQPSTLVEEFSCVEKKPDISNIGLNSSCNGNELKLTWKPISGLNKYLIRGTRNLPEEIKPWTMNRVAKDEKDGKTELDKWWTGDKTVTPERAPVTHNLEETIVCDGSRGSMNGMCTCTTDLCTYTWQVPNPVGGSSTPSPTDNMAVWIHAVDESDKLGDTVFPINSDHVFVEKHVSCAPKTPGNFSASCQNGAIVYNWDQPENASKYLFRAVKGSTTLPPDGAPRFIAANDVTNVTCKDGKCSFTPEERAMPGDQLFVWMHSRNEGPITSDLAGVSVTCPIPKVKISEKPDGFTNPDDYEEHAFAGGKLNLKYSFRDVTPTNNKTLYLQYTTDGGQPRTQRLTFKIPEGLPQDGSVIIGENFNVLPAWDIKKDGGTVSVESNIGGLPGSVLKMAKLNDQELSIKKPLNRDYTNTLYRVMFYDNLQSDLGTIFAVKDKDNNLTGLGVRTDTNKDNYYIRINGEVFDAKIKRHKGWHLFELIVTDSGTYSKIDNILVQGGTDGNTFNRSQKSANSIELISSWVNKGDAFYKDLLVVRAPTLSGEDVFKQQATTILSGYYQNYKQLDLSPLINNFRELQGTRDADAKTFSDLDIKNALNNLRIDKNPGYYFEMSKPKYYERFCSGNTRTPPPYSDPPSSEFISWVNNNCTAGITMSTDEIKTLNSVSDRLKQPLNGWRSVFDTVNALYAYGKMTNNKEAKDKALAIYLQALPVFNNQDIVKFHSHSNGVTIGSFVYATYFIQDELNNSEKAQAKALVKRLTVDFYTGEGKSHSSDGSLSTMDQWIKDAKDGGVMGGPGSEYIGGSWTEDNAWIADTAAAIFNLFPEIELTDSQQRRLEGRALCFGFHSLTRGNESVDLRVRELYPECSPQTKNLYDDYKMDNHGWSPNPIYTMGALNSLSRGARTYKVAGKQIPQEFLHDLQPFYTKFAEQIDTPTFLFKGSDIKFNGNDLNLPYFYHDWYGATATLHYAPATLKFLQDQGINLGFNLNDYFSKRSIFFYRMQSEWVLNHSNKINTSDSQGRVNSGYYNFEDYRAVGDNTQQRYFDYVYFMDTNVAGNATAVGLMLDEKAKGR